MSFVNTDKGAVSFGVFDLSSLPFLAFLGRATGEFDIRSLTLNGESLRLDERPLRVRIPSLAVFDRGVGGL